MESIDRFLTEKYRMDEGATTLKEMYEAYLCFCDRSDLEFARKGHFVNELFKKQIHRKYHKAARAPYFIGIIIT